MAGMLTVLVFDNLTAMPRVSIEVQQNAGVDKRSAAPGQRLLDDGPTRLGFAFSTLGAR